MTALLDSLMAITPDELAAMSGDEQAWVTSTLEREVLLSSPASFATGLSNGAWEPYRHLVHTSNRIVAMIEDDATDCLLVEEPVRHGKSELCSKWTPAWYICKFRKRVMLASYEGDFAATWGRKAREIVAEHGPGLGVRIDESSRAAHRWDLIAPDDGGMVCAGAGGAITGKGGHLCIVDDPIKGREDADSAIMREHLWQWWGSVFLTRREPGAKIIVIMSRWHEDDLVARIIANETDLRVAS